MNLLKAGQTVSPPFILARSMQDKRKDISRMLESLQSRGRFLVSPTGEAYYFDTKTCLVVAIEENDRDFMMLMGRHDFCPDRAFIERAQRHTLSFGSTAGIYRMAHVNLSTSTVYVYSQGVEVFKISASGIETVQNGDDDVYFVREQGSNPFSMVDSPAGCGKMFLDHIVKPFNLSASSISSDQMRFTIMAWCCSLFMSEMLPVMPLLVLVGPQSSGKTCFMRMLSELLFGSQLSVIRTPGDPKMFDAVLGRHKIVCMDNVTEWSSWLDNRLESIVRRETVHVKLGTQVVEHRLDCAMAMTARQFPDAGLNSITRMLPVVLGKPENSVPERVLVEAVKQNRNVIMTQLMHYLQKLLADIDSGAPGYTGLYGAADFADMAYRLARTIGFEQQMADAFDRMAELHDAALLGDQQVFMLLDHWLSSPGNVDRKVKATELQKEIEVVAKEKGVAFSMTERSFAHWLKARLNDIRQFFVVHAWEARSRQFFYRFSQKQVEPADF